MMKLNPLANGSCKEASEASALWSPPPDTLVLQDDEVHVWRASLHRKPSAVQTILSPDERNRAERFRFPKDRERFIAARGLLRILLGRYLNRHPGKLQFGYNRYGKPALVGASEANALRFNVSHSHELALYAVTRGREIGVDVERIRMDVACEQLAERFFSPREVALLRAIPAPLRRRAFFACWTRKEAYIKARGEGLALLNQFDVALVPGEPAALLSAPLEEASRWSLVALDPGPGYVGALAVEGGGWRLACWQWPEQEPSRQGMRALGAFR